MQENHPDLAHVNRPRTWNGGCGFRDPPGPGTAPIAVATVGHVLPSPLPHSELPPSDAAPDRRVVEDNTSPIEVSLYTPRSEAPAGSASTSQRCGKAPPIEFFSGEDPAITLDDWGSCVERMDSSRQADAAAWLSPWMGTTGMATSKPI